MLWDDFLYQIDDYLPGFRTNRDAVNIGARDLGTRLYGGAFDVAGSVVLGTTVGLVIKYILDMRYIFGPRSRDSVHDGKTFVLYTFMGLATTVVFWACEYGFHQMFQTKEMRYVGGLVKLTIGELTKNRLDKRCVLRTERA